MQQKNGGNVNFCYQFIIRVSPAVLPGKVSIDIQYLGAKNTYLMYMAYAVSRV